ncbi:hypothetical protein [Nostoc sp. FACHB-892]|nr:hypothetical protein [Nostoc sp. FACHB-892]
MTTTNVSTWLDWARKQRIVRIMPEGEAGKLQEMRQRFSLKQ